MLNIWAGRQPTLFAYSRLKAQIPSLLSLALTLCRTNLKYLHAIFFLLVCCSPNISQPLLPTEATSQQVPNGNGYIEAGVVYLWVGLEYLKYFQVVERGRLGDVDVSWSRESRCYFKEAKWNYPVTRQFLWSVWPRSGWRANHNDHFTSRLTIGLRLQYT